jgi:hypothetical protein
MPFKTLTDPVTVYLLVNSGGRNYFGGAFPAYPDPAVEAVFFAQKRCPNFPLSVQPAVAAGVARACAEGLRLGERLCSVRLEPDLLRSHDVDTTEEAERKAYYFVLEQLWEQASAITAAPAWKTPEALDVARGFRASGDAGCLPVLADALEEAGCGVPLVLRHLRECHDHGGRCWVADLLLEEPAPVQGG